MRVCVSIVTFAMAGVLLGGCETGAHDAQALCTALCDCESTAPAIRDRCIAQCVPQVPAVLPDGCVQCVLTASCTELDTGTCQDLCTDDEPPSRQHAPTPTEETP